MKLYHLLMMIGVLTEFLGDYLVEKRYSEDFVRNIIIIGIVIFTIGTVLSLIE